MDRKRALNYAAGVLIRQFIPASVASIDRAVPPDPALSAVPFVSVDRVTLVNP